jgi:hypothetical protein
MVIEYFRLSQWAFLQRIVIKAAGEVVSQTLSSAPTCFLPALLTLPARLSGRASSGE